MEAWKRPLARIAADCEPGAPALPDAEAVPFPGAHDALAQLGWWDLVEEARSGVVDFAGGELRIFVTPAMTLIDVDGTLPAKELAMAAARAAVGAILRHNIGGSIGIDFPTVAGKSERQAVAEAVDSGLPQPFERTAVNGFGFMQLIRPRRHPSTFEFALDRPAFEARVLLRRAAVQGIGARTLVAHPAVIARLQSSPHWLDALARQLGGAVGLRADPALPMSGGHAEQA